MTASKPKDNASPVADLLHEAAPWEVYAERARRYEVHLNGTEIELIRGPLTAEGYGLRVFRPRNGLTGIGFQASSDFSAEGVAAALDDAETIARHSEFPAKSVALPAPTTGRRKSVRVLDRTLWDQPMERILEYIDVLKQQFSARSDVAPSFGSVRATLSEASVANSEGLRAAFSHTLVDFEVAVKSFGGPEGAPPGEYWVNETTRRLEPEKLPAAVENWCRYAADVRRAAPPPTGERTIVLPAGVLAGILPPVLGFRFSGAARLRKIAPEVGGKVATEAVTLRDDGTLPWAVASSPVDDEGSAQKVRTLISRGVVEELLYDSTHAAAFGVPGNSSAVRGLLTVGYRDWMRFAHPPGPGSSTLVLAPGDGGSEEELLESAGDGIWVQQLGWASPDSISGAFGGEIRIGYRIRNGKRAEPVRGGTVGGTVFGPPGRPTLLQNIQAIGSSAEMADSLLAPPIVVRPLTVGGEGE